jgi:hypothetical protein
LRAIRHIRKLAKTQSFFLIKQVADWKKITKPVSERASEHEKGNFSLTIALSRTPDMGSA